MARFILITAAVIAAGRVLWPGTTVDSNQEDTAAMTAKGARLFAADNATVAAAAEQAVTIKRRGGTIEQAGAVMAGAAQVADAAIAAAATAAVEGTAGPAGADGADGADGAPGPAGADGKNAFTVTTEATTWGNPNETLYVIVEAGTVDWMIVGQWIDVGDGITLGTGTVYTVGAESPEALGIQVVVVLDHSTAGNPTVGTVIAAGAKVSPAGKPA